MERLQEDLGGPRRWPRKGHFHSGPGGGDGDSSKQVTFFFFTLKFILFMYSLLHPFQNEKMCLSSMQILLNPPSFLPQVKNEGEGLPVSKW